LKNMTLPNLLPFIMVVAFACGIVQAVEPADLVVHSATVITVNAAAPRARAFAIRGGTFAFVGEDAAVTDFIGPATTVIDLAGKTVTPGFIDAHAHPVPVYAEESAWAPVDCRPRAVKDVAELIAALERKAQRTPPGTWVVGEGYENLKLGRHPTRWDLDRASERHPIIVHHYSGHERVVNSLALRTAGIAADVADPPGGRFGRDRRGELTGLLQEKATLGVSIGFDPPAAETRAAYTEGYRRLLARGVTTVGVAGTSLPTARTLELARSDDAPLRLCIALGGKAIQEAVTRKPPTAADEHGVRYGAIKVFHGGSVSAHTGWVSEPYVGIDARYGVIPQRSQEELNRLLLTIHDAGWQAWVHCNGDREIDMVVSAFERILATSPRKSHRHRLEHCSVMTPALLERIKPLDLVLVPHSYMWEHGDILDAYHPRLWDDIHPTKSAIDLGIVRAGHSDGPGVSSCDPLMHIQALVTRKSLAGRVYGPAQRITPEQAITVWTLNGAYATCTETERGSIEVGKLADFVVLDADPTAVDADAIMNIPLRATYVGGRKVYQAR